ncbi:hypothetical protein [Klebsiella pneumoniae]|uniref:hypothetical protein n=1 Tax=Klebsiella pneumoniae TaxID=573 RepID=UPI000D1BEE2E|nr:hypothetical protein [Klebsiella pneumoniae]
MSSLNKALFDAAYKWHCDQGNRIFIALNGKCISTNPILRSFIKPTPDVEGYEYLVLNISPHSCQLQSFDEGLFFEGRFGGKLASDTFSWDKVRVVLNPDTSDQNLPLPYPVITGKEEVDPVTPPENVTPMKKANPFSVIDGGKE